MAESSEVLRRKIDGAGDLQAVVRTMKALAASTIGQYERAVLALDDYYYTVELGLKAYLLQDDIGNLSSSARNRTTPELNIIVFGSDQGLVGQFNDQIAEFTTKTLKQLPGKKNIWSVGERVFNALSDIGFVPEEKFILPTSVNAITSLIGEILKKVNLLNVIDEIPHLYLFYNKPTDRAFYSPSFQRLLPLDNSWKEESAVQKWPTKKWPQVLESREQIFKKLVGEFLFVSIFRACADSLASENISRLAAMQRAEKNIEELLSNLNQEFHQLRQNSIDEELFDVISGFESLK